MKNKAGKTNFIKDNIPGFLFFLKYTITKTSYLIIRKFTVVEKEGDRAVGFL